ncbi:MAG: hypothetical protein ACK500_06130 [Flavobacteriales bacterium]
MKPDFYTKSVLTVIAICLVILVLKDNQLFTEAHATEQLPTSGVTYGLVPINPDGSINVNITSSLAEMDVNIVDINTRENMNVNIEEVDAFAFTFCTVPVEVK